ncbi:MAG TPA: glycoside hydrolase family 3 N-terminal domain-containing protein [Candidatus Limnocylindria bacterium]|nr:glycoside hydrolase family 3 N-terminal domain-containing protein [Candidatus Limnocylindria bacterium]
MRPGPGALVWAGFDGPEVPGALLDAIRDGRVGGLLLFAFRGNISGKEQVRAMLREAQAAAARGGLPPVPVAVDQEGGTVVRIAYRAVFPSAMAIGATGDPQYAERAAGAVGEGLLADGIGVDHAPVCDVNADARNPVIGTRSFGDDPVRVADFAAAWVRGSEGVGVATTPKHFPGHGATEVDSHHTTVDVKADRGTLDARELVPFRAAFAAGASGAMTAHVRYPALDPENIATLSPRILVDLLRTELGFTGLAMTDSLDMSGVTLVATPDELVGRAVRAGIDAVMVTSGLERQLAAAEAISTQVPAPRVLEALRRAAAFRERFGLPVPDGDVDDRPARSLAAEIAAASITANATPPAHLREIRVAYLPPAVASPVEELRDPAALFEAALRRRFGVRLTFAVGTAPEGDAPLIVCTSSASFDRAQADRARALLAGAALHCAMRSPYDVALQPQPVPTLLTYGDVPASLDALAAVLAGEREPAGRAPVSLPGFPRA